MNHISTIISDILTTVYENFWAGLVFSVLTMTVILYADRIGLKTIIAEWIENFKSSRKFKIQFIFYLYIYLMLGRTIIGRSLWSNPLSKVMGNWYIFDSSGNINSELFENIILFIPFTLLLLLVHPGISRKLKLERKRPALNILLFSVFISFAGSFAIESVQLLFHLGTFQISDLCMNTLGGFIGGWLYLLLCYIRRFYKMSKKHTE